jgi:hypothetical protein
MDSFISVSRKDDLTAILALNQTGLALTTLGIGSAYIRAAVLSQPGTPYYADRLGMSPQMLGKIKNSYKSVC